jgi:ABC-type nickel/cobalt efflux system permease component RcnA
MSVIPLTLTISLCLVFTFVIFFLRETSRRRYSSPERDALLPLADEMPHIVEKHPHGHSHEHADHECGCRTGKRAPCVGCLKNHSHHA